MFITVLLKCSIQFYQWVWEFPNDALCERTTAVLQLPEVWPPGQDLQLLRWKTLIEPVQGQQNSRTQVRILWTGACHHQSALPKETGSREQSKDIGHTSTQITYNQTSQQKPVPIPLKNAWPSLTIQEVEKRPFSEQSSTPQTTTIGEQMEVRTKQPKQTARNSIPKTMQNRKPETVKVVSAPQQTTNAWTKPFVSSIMEFLVATSANRTKLSLSGPSAKQYQPVNKLQTKHQNMRNKKWTMYW